MAGFRVLCPVRGRFVGIPCGFVGIHLFQRSRRKICDQHPLNPLNPIHSNLQSKTHVPRDLDRTRGSAFALRLYLCRKVLRQDAPKEIRKDCSGASEWVQGASVSLLFGASALSALSASSSDSSPWHTRVFKRCCSKHAPATLAHWFIGQALASVFHASQSLPAEKKS